MKKFLAILLAMLMAMSMMTVAMADEEINEPVTTPTTVTLAKVVTVTNSGTTMPKQTFKFDVTNAGVSNAASTITTSNMPKPTISDVVYNEGDTGTKSITITYPTYTSVGVYTYTIKEQKGNTPGMTYDETARTLKVTVVNDGNGGFKVAGTTLVNNVDDKKSDSFQNYYKAGSLKVTKKIDGQMGVKSEKFAFTVTLTSDVNVESSVGFNNATLQWSQKDGKYTTTAQFSLSDGESATITNIPYGVSYTVVEDNATKDPSGNLMNGDYVVTSTGDTGTIAAAETTAAFTNTKQGTVETGVSLDSLPYVLMLALAGAGLVLMIARKRRVED